MATSNEIGVSKFSPREYQLELLEAAIEKNIIICLGTGTGKTFISIKLIEYLAREDDIMRPFSQGAKRTFFLVNSVPLVFQQADAIKMHSALNVKSFCGEMCVDFWSKDDWLKEFENNHVLVMTHQIYLDLLQHAKLKLSQANLLVFDECHHANKNHPFKKIMDRFVDFPEVEHPRVLGLTASVVGKKVRPQNIPREVEALERTMRCVCRTASDPDIVEKYGAKPCEKIQRFSSSELTDEVAIYLECEFRDILNPFFEFLQNLKVLRDKNGIEEVIVKELAVVKSAVGECLAALGDIGVWAAYEIAKMLITDLEKRLNRVSNHLSPQAKYAGLLLQSALTSLRQLSGTYDEFRKANFQDDGIQEGYLKPKVKELLKVFGSRRDVTDVCSIVFVERRYAACVLSKLINTLALVNAQCYGHLKSDFVTGHGADTWGISETEMNFLRQQEKLKDFRDGKFNVLVGTSVVEEGVDIPKCNLIVMFDFPKNFRAYVQSRGRGRAKNAQYILLVEEEEFYEKEDELEMYQCVDKYLTKICQGSRTEPTEEESKNAVNVYSLESYYTTAGARLDMASSISLVHRYCSKLPCDRFTRLSPQFKIHDLGEKFQCTLQMPRNSHITSVIQGEPMVGKKEAKMAVALKACRMLHEKGGLNDHLLPVDSGSESESDDYDEPDGVSHHKTGTRKRVRSHYVNRVPQVRDKLVTDGTIKLHVYAITIEFTAVFDTAKSYSKKVLWDGKKIMFGLITNVNLPPELPSFPLHNDIGQVSVSLVEQRTVRKLRSLTREQRELVEWFHWFVFVKVLGFRGSLTGQACRIVILNVDDSAIFSGVNFDEMKSIKTKAENCDRKISADTDLLDSIVIPIYRFNAERDKKYELYMVKSLSHLTPCSPFPNLTQARTYKDYFERKYNLTINNLTQPLVEVVRLHRKIDCRRKSPQTSLRDFEEHLIPETLEVWTCPQSVTLRAFFLPSILYRVESLVSMVGLRDTLAGEAGIGDSSLDFDHDRCATDLPRKRLKFSFACNVEKREEIGEGFRRKSFVSTLDRYFYPFDSSKSVPLLKLLEAVTCASSGDAFDLERLEMLGDSFLKMAVSIYVYWHKNNKDEGKLTNYRTREICNKNLFNLASQKGLPKYIKSSIFSRDTWAPPGLTLGDTEYHENGEELSSCEYEDKDDWRIHHDDVICDDVGSRVLAQQRISDKSIADSVEALIGAHLIHCGYIGALKFMTWLGLHVLHSPTSDVEGTSSVHRNSALYANYPSATFEIPEDVERYHYEEVLLKQTKEMASFEEKIKYSFKNKVLLLEAFTHPTYNDNTVTASYQRLEFLGDAILDFLVTQHIYNHCEEDLSPGKLTDLRSALVNNNIFATIAVENDYHRYLKEYSPSLFSCIGGFVKAVHELSGKVNPNPYVIAAQDLSGDDECIEAPKPLGDIFESVAGAIFVDSNMDIHTVWKIYYPMLQRFIDEYSANIPVNPVRRVLEIDEKAKFRLVSAVEDKVSYALRFGDDAEARMACGEFVGSGRNKHHAKLSAAYKALRALNLL